MGNGISAIADLSAAIRLDPNDATNYHNRGCIYCSEKDYDKAIADFTEVIRLKREDIWGLYYRAICYANKRQYAEAISDLDAVIERDPREPYFFEKRAAFCILQGDFDRALADFQTMMKLNPQDPAAHFETAKKHPLDEKDLEHGERQLRQMLKDRPAMGEIGEKADPLYRWAGRKFAGEDLGERILWNPAEPPPEFPCDHQSPEPGCPGFIRIHEKYTAGPLKGKAMSFEELWSGAVFELYNITGVEDFQRIQNEATEGRLAREEYITGELEVESRAAEKTCRVLYPRLPALGERTRHAH